MLPKSLSSFHRVRSYRYLLLVALIAAAAFHCLRATSWRVRAATVTVTNTNDSGAGSLRAAIAAAAGGDTINFNLSGCPCTIALTSGELVINKGLTIQGPGAGQLTISGNNTFRVFFINPGVPGATTPPVSPFLNVNFFGLTIANGRAKGGDGGQQDYGGKGGGGGGMGGAIFINGGQVALSQVSFFNNQSVGGNGAVAFGNGSGNGTGGGGAFGNGSSSFGGFVGTPGGNGGNFGGLGGNGASVAGVAGGNGGDGGGGGGAANSSDTSNGGNGGNGGFGGGGGGGAGQLLATGHFPGVGGNGGFGGGGGGGGVSSSSAGGATALGGTSGTFGGNGGTGVVGIDSIGTGGSGAGGGGAGLGGAVFLRLGSLLIVNTSFTNNTATRGLGGPGFIAATSGSNGQGKGGAIFVLPGANAVMCSNTGFSGNSASDALGSAGDTNDVYGTIQSTDQCNLSPTASNDSYLMNEGTGLSVDDPGVLANDSDLDGDALTAVLVSGPSHAGAFILRSDGSFNYQPNGDFSGLDSFSYKARDSHNFDSNTATVLITINPSNDPPTYVPGPNVTVTQTGPYSSPWATDISPGPPDESGQTLSFFVTGNTNPGLFSSAPSIASNGTLSFTPAANANGTSTITIVLKDDGGTANSGNDTSFPYDFTITVAPNNLRINDAKVAEPSAGSVNMIFAVTLSAPAPAGGASVNFTTMDEVSAITHAKAGLDYTTSNGTLTFAAGEQFKTISVPVLADNLGESNETFLLILSNPVNSTLADDTATGTIRILNLPGTLLISELRTTGPAGTSDEFVEISNNTNSPITVATADASAGYGLFKMGTDCNATPVLIGTIPNGTIIPERGHYLFVGSQYSLANYGGTGAAAGDQTLSANIETDANVSLFSTAEVGNLSSDNRLDAVGFAANTVGNCNLLSEGTVLPATGFTNLEGSYQRDQCGKLANSALFGGCAITGLLKDTNSNVADFFWADTAATNTTAGQHLGAPGPENLASPLVRNSLLPALFLDATQPSTLAPNRVRDLTPVTNGTLGTMTVRRRYRNDTGGPVTRLRFRIVDISTLPTPAGVADLRALTSPDVVVSSNDSQTCSAFSLAAPCSVNVIGTTVESPPTQALGGGNNTTMTVTLGAPLPVGASINVQLRVGVQTAGSFKFVVNVEALP